jgi:hypothetical protein
MKIKFDKKDAIILLMNEIAKKKSEKIYSTICNKLKKTTYRLQCQIGDAQQKVSYFDRFNEYHCFSGVQLQI